MRHTEETKARLSAMRMGEANPFYGKTHTPETKQRLAEHSRIRNLSKTYEPAPQRIVLPDRETCAYLAGMIDADGSIRFKTDHSTKVKTPRPHVTIYNTNRDLIDWLMETLGHGCVSKGNMGREQVLSWTIQGACDVYALLNAIRPWLIVKAADADIAITHLREKYQWA